MGEALSPGSIDGTIGQMEKLYRAVTGQEPPGAESTYAPIPAETDPTRHVEEQLDRLMSLLGPTTAGVAAPSSWTPPLCAAEGESEVLLCLDLPGVTRERVDVRVQGNTVTVSGQSSSPMHEGLRLRINEGPAGYFHRTIPLPAGTNPETVKARLRDGVLEIRAPREVSQSSTSRSVPIE